MQNWRVPSMVESCKANACYSSPRCWRAIQVRARARRRRRSPSSTPASRSAGWDASRWSCNTPRGRSSWQATATRSPSLWRSDDNGHSWSSVDVGTHADGAYGNSDVELAVGPDSALYFLNMSFDRQKLEGTRIDVATSRDGGSSWQWQQLSDTRLVDRPWIDVSPDNSAHAIWNDGAGIAHVRSTDGGRSWTELSRVHSMGGSSHMAVGPQGEVAVRVAPLSVSGNSFNAGEDWLFVSTDRGEKLGQAHAAGDEGLAGDARHDGRSADLERGRPSRAGWSRSPGTPRGRCSASGDTTTGCGSRARATRG